MYVYLRLDGNKVFKNIVIFIALQYPFEIFCPILDDDNIYSNKKKIISNTKDQVIEQNLIITSNINV